jgi:5-amino-6-(5-phosphoribosylamino)uracil reductase
MATLAEQDAIDEWYLTICPLMLGGATAPTPVDGVGTLAALAPQFTLIQVQTVENEVFLHYRRCQPPKD